ncbi:hypothetical protein K438DRAFT_1226131 [Mycena galopus ATCC 62051]|nr:hypothetical protein K438DRAFT_1226131 [Mycena galopus ATCC 62051]
MCTIWVTPTACCLVPASLLYRLPPVLALALCPPWKLRKTETFKVELQLPSEGFDIRGGNFAAGDIHCHGPPAQGGSNQKLISPPSPTDRSVIESTTVAPWPDATTDYSENEIYFSQLLRRRRGFPLYNPGPQRNLPPQYQKRGVGIGDVGRVTPEGVFDFFFNIYLPPQHPINANDVPDDFSPLEPYASKDIVELDFDPGNYVASRSIEVRDCDDDSLDFPGGKFHFNCKGPHGAVLALPYGSHLWKLENLELVRQYATRNAESWYKYINCNRGRGLTNGSLYLITGCEKSASGGIATFQNIATGHDFQLSSSPPLLQTSIGSTEIRARSRSTSRPLCRVPILRSTTPLLSTDSLFPLGKGYGGGFLETSVWAKLRTLNCRKEGAIPRRSVIHRDPSFPGHRVSSEVAAVKLGRENVLREGVQRTSSFPTYLPLLPRSSIQPN